MKGRPVSFPICAHTRSSKPTNVFRPFNISKGKRIRKEKEKMSAKRQNTLLNYSFLADIILQ
jgi:hypothetical protein